MRPAAGAPRQADLRRAVSSSYYALFHAVLSGAGDLIVGQARRNTAIYSLVYRTPNHRAVKKLFNQILSHNPKDPIQSYLPEGGFGADAIAFARAFVELQEKRERSDYDPLYRISASEAALAIATGRAALIHWAAMPREQRETILLLSLFQLR
jgi:hypothetical protein